MSLQKPDVYGAIHRGLTKRKLIPWGTQNESGVKIANIVTRNGLTIVGSVVVSNTQGRTYFDFQNQSGASDMRINFGFPATADIGILIPAGGSRIWDARADVGVVSDTVYVFCAVADQRYAYSEASQ